MIFEGICIDFRCKGCGAVRRIDVTDLARAVGAYRPESWDIAQDGVRCVQCAVSAPRVEMSAPGPAANIPPGMDVSQQMRDQLSGLHMARPAEATPAMGQGSIPGRNEVRRGNFVFEDTRSQNEFLGPEKVTAGVPTTSERCLGFPGACGQLIVDGSAWRLVQGSLINRGHKACLDKAGLF